MTTSGILTTQDSDNSAYFVCLDYRCQKQNAGKYVSVTTTLPTLYEHVYNDLSHIDIMNVFNKTLAMTPVKIMKYMY